MTGKLAALAFRINYLLLTGNGGDSINFMADNGATVGFFSGPDAVAGYKLIDVGGTPNVIALNDAGKKTFTHAPTDGDILQVSVTPTTITVSVTPLSGDIESYTITNNKYVDVDYKGMA